MLLTQNQFGSPNLYYDSKPFSTDRILLKVTNSGNANISETFASSGNPDLTGQMDSRYVLSIKACFPTCLFYSFLIKNLSRSPFPGLRTSLQQLPRPWA